MTARAGTDGPADAWTLAFAGPDRSGGFVRLTRAGRDAWYWAYLVGPDTGLVVVRDHELAAPRPAGPLVVRGDGLWAELLLDPPAEHWSVGLEAFGVRLGDPLDADRGERGDRLPVGLDLDWDSAAGPFGRVDGDAAVGATRRTVAATGHAEHWAGRRPARRLIWQTDAAHGRSVEGDAVGLTLDRAGLPAGVTAAGQRFPVAAVAVVPAPTRVVLALVGDDAGWGWLEWRPGAEGPAGRLAGPGGGRVA